MEYIPVISEAACYEDMGRSGGIDPNTLNVIKLVVSFIHHLFSPQRKERIPEPV
jgi:hypothetical protein